MPYEIKKTPSCPVSKPFGVFNKNTGDLRGRCHESRAKALAQMRALYAAESGKMNSEAAVVTLVKSFSDEWMDGNRKWIKVYPFSSWTHPLFSDTSIDEETAQALKDSFDRKLYGEQDYVVTYDHGLDPAKGGKAAGWYEQLEVREDGLYGLVRFTDTARQEIEAGEWRYFSGEHYDEFKHPHTGEINNLVFCGGAITNKPYVKEGMVPLNFSDIYTEKEYADYIYWPKEYADWSTAYKNNLSDSAFLYIEPGGKKDSEGKTVPRSLRHFPVRDANGKVDLAHVRNALARIPQSNVPDNVKSRCIAAARRLLGSKGSSEAMNDDAKPKDEHVPEEHADPGQVNDPPIEGANTDDGAEGSRVDTPPPAREDNVESALDKKLREVLNLDPDADIIKAVSDLTAEVQPLRDAAKSHSERKTFKDVYPDEFARMERLEKRERTLNAKSFSEKFSRLVDKDGKSIGKGYPAVVTDKLEELHKKFSEGHGTINDVEETMLLMARTGTIEYKEQGSSLLETDYTDDTRDPAKIFSDKVAEVMENDNLDIRAATDFVVKEHRQIYENYRESLPGYRRS